MKEKNCLSTDLEICIKDPNKLCFTILPRDPLNDPAARAIRTPLKRETDELQSDIDCQHLPTEGTNIISFVAALRLILYPFKQHLLDEKEKCEKKVKL